MKLLITRAILLFATAISIAVQAKDYDLNQSNNGLCSGGRLNGNTYYCSSSISLNAGDTISYSGSLDAITLDVSGNITFGGGNIIGEGKSVSLKSSWGNISITGAPSQVFGSITASAHITLENIETSAPITTGWGTIKITGSSNPGGVNTVIGDITSNGSVELENISLTGKINTGSYLNVSGESNRIYGDISAASYISILATENLVTGAVSAGSWVQLSNIDVQGNVTSLYDYITISGANNAVAGYVEANNNITLNSIQVAGAVTSHTGTMTITGEKNDIGGAITANNNVKLSNVKVSGDILSKSTTVTIDGTGNSVIGDITSNNGIDLKEIKVCGSVKSSYSTVSITGTDNGIYSTGDAVGAFHSISIDNTEICGPVSTTYGNINQTNSQFYCSLNGDCDDAAKVCPANNEQSPCDDSSVLSELPDICSYFPEPLATNRYNNQGELHSNAKIEVEKGNGAGNWLFLPNETPLSFKDFSLKDVGGCKLYDGTVISCAATERILFDGTPPEPERFTATGDDIVVPDASTVTISTPGNYKSLSFGRNGSRLILESGEYWIGDITIHENDAHIIVDGPVVLHYNEISIGADRVSINTTSLDTNPVTPDDLTLIGHGNKSGLDFDGGNSHDVTINANWYVSPEDHGGFKLDKVDRFQYTGAMIAAQVEFKASSTSWIKAYQPQGCGDIPEPEGYEVFVEPETSLALTCETVPVRVEVHKDEDLDLTYFGHVTLTLNNGSSMNSMADSGVATFNLDSTQVTELSVGAYITVDDTQYSSASETVKFVPQRYRVLPATINMVAGGEADFSLTPLECHANGTPVASPEFVGNQAVDLGSVSYAKPTIPVARQTAQVLGSNQQYVTTPDSNTVDLQLSFDSTESDPSAYSKVKYDEAGKITFTVSSTVCSSEEDDEASLVDEDCRTYDGIVTVQARPWTMAICDSNNAMANGTSNTNPTTQAEGAYRAAGQEFDLSIKPIKWRDGLDAGDQTHDTFCTDDSLVTKNYFAKDAWSDSVTLSHKVVTPSGGSDGQLGGIITQGKTDGVVNSDYFLNFGQLTISEVGSFTITADSTGSNYGDIENGIVDGARTLGRFYPAYFTLESLEWNEPANQGYVNYMDQPFSQVTATAYAYSALGNKLSNYHLSGFEGNRVEFPSLSDSQGYASRIENWYSDDTWEAEVSGDTEVSVWSPVLQGIVFGRKPDTEVRRTVADGPFNTDSATLITSLALDIAAGPLGDPVTYVWGSDEYSSVLSHQPKVRYGRMALADVAGNVSNSISVPLKVEYFDGTGFVTNSDDSASEFDVDKLCLLSGVSSNAQFTLSSGEAKVADGENNALRVSRSGTNTDIEQVRLFLRQGDSAASNPPDINCSGNHFTQPWLQFNWRDEGDEDPSTLVTFGAYRGNDRIIFRGEPGLTGQ